MDIISKKLANGFFYAYHAGRFWRWDEGRKLWKESHLLAKKYDLNHEYDKLLTPEDFLADPALFARQDDVIQLPAHMVEALQTAQPCQNAPIDPVEEPETAVSAPAVTQDIAEQFSNIPTAPSFDFGADDQTNALLLQDAQTFITGNMARIMAAKHAHDLTANHYRGSWGKWCAAVGISRDTGDRMVSVAAQCGNIQLEGKSIFDVQPMKLLYAAAKPSTPDAVKQAVFSGDITTYKEYQEALAQIKAEKDRADAAEAREEEAWSMVSKAQGEAQTAKADLEVAQKARADAEDEASAAKGQLDAATADVQGLAEQNARLNREKAQVEDRAAKAEEALRHQPIAGVVDKEEVQRQAKKLFADMADEEIDRRAHQQAYGIAADLNAGAVAEKEQLRKELDGLRKNNTQLERRMKDMTSQLGDLSQTDFETANYCPTAMLSIWNSCKGSYSRLTGDDLESTFLCICNAVNAIKKEASLLCRQPSDYQG